MTVRLDPSGADKGVVLDQPPIHVTSWDYQRLSGVVEAFRSRGCESLVELLSEELDRAELVEPAAVPRDVVTMHSCVRFIDHDTDEVRCITLVYPGEEDSRQGRITIITPVGSALLGLRPGATMAWRTMDGRIKRLSVLEVRSQPEASGFDGAAVRDGRNTARPRARMAAQ
jgi:regulator of nucleoside diphosphate kinase